MSDVKRYDLLGEYSDTHIGEFLDGDYVRFADYETLRAELTEARRQLKEAESDLDHMQQCFDDARGQWIKCMDELQEARNQKPVAWMNGDKAKTNEQIQDVADYGYLLEQNGWTPLYAAPVPQPAVSQSDIVRVYVGESPMPEEAPPPDGVTLFARVDSLQPAVPEVVRKLIEQLLSDYESATDEEYSGTSYYAGRVEFQNRARAILSATDSEVKNG